MSYLHINTRIGRHLLFIAIALLCSVAAGSQTKEAQESLKIAPVKDDDDDDTDRQDTACRKHCCMVQHPITASLSADFGGSDVFSHISNNNYTSLGLTWAANANVDFRLPCRNDDNKAFICLGLEVRNYNTVAAGPDRLGGTAYDNLHYWYAGIPIMYQFLTKHNNEDKTKPTGIYGQVGVTFGTMLHVNNYYSAQGENTNYDLTKQYTTFMVQPFVSGGVTYQAHHCTYLLGPYLGYVATNMLHADGASEHILSFGLRLTTLFLNN